MSGAAEIVASGFQRYEGNRSGVAGAIRSVAWQSVRATLGLGRLARYKVFPITTIVLAYLPAVVFVGLAVLVGDILDPQEVADYPGYYAYITMVIVLFAALVAPEVLVSDRRNGMLALYLSTPLRRSTYLAAKGIAVAASLALVTLFPPLLLLAGYTIEGVGPDGPRGWLVDLVRIVLSGVTVSAAMTSVSMAASSLTDRRAFAAIGVVLVAISTPALAAALVEVAEMSPNWRLIDVFSMSYELVYRIFGEAGDYPELATWAVCASNVAWTVGGLAVVAWRYSNLVVAR